MLMGSKISKTIRRAGKVPTLMIFLFGLLWIIIMFVSFGSGYTTITKTTNSGCCCMALLKKQRQQLSYGTIAFTRVSSSSSSISTKLNPLFKNQRWGEPERTALWMTTTSSSAYFNDVVKLWHSRRLVWNTSPRHTKQKQLYLMAPGGTQDLGFSRRRCRWTTTTITGDATDDCSALAILQLESRPSWLHQNCLLAVQRSGSADASNHDGSSSRRIPLSRNQSNRNHSNSSSTPSSSHLSTGTIMTTSPTLASRSGVFNTATRSLSSTKQEQQHQLQQRQEQQRKLSLLLLKDLNPAQVEAVSQPLAGLTRLIAGPGSGKTKTLISRIAYLLIQSATQQQQQQKQQQHYYPVQQSGILAVTFTRKAAAEMQQRLNQWAEMSITAINAMSSTSTTSDNGNNSHDEMDPRRDTSMDNIPIRLDRVTMGTFHSICAKILRWNGVSLKSLPSVMNDMMGSTNVTTLDGSFAIIDQSEQLRIVRDCLAVKGITNDRLEEYNLKPTQILTSLGKCRMKKSEGIDPFLPASWGEAKFLPRSILVAKEIYSLYRERLLCTNTLDYDDLILFTRELLQVYPIVQQQLHSRWPHVLVDEFQDTSKAQLDLVKLWTSSSLFVVGDADQSIYAWRGANYNSLQDLDNDFQHHSCPLTTIHLRENYRSTTAIVQAAEKIISGSEASESGPSSAARLRRSMKPMREFTGTSPLIVPCDDEKAEAEYVVSTVKNKLKSNELAADSTVAIIYRTNAQSRALEEACVKHNLPYVIFGSATSFYQRREIKDCLCFLRWLQNGRDRGSMLRALETPKRGIGPSTIESFDEYYAAISQSWADGYPGTIPPSPLDVVLSLSGSTDYDHVISSVNPSTYIAKAKLNLLTQFSRDMRSIRDQAYARTVEQLLQYIVDTLHIIPHLEAISKSTSEFQDREANVGELRKAAQRYSDRGPCLQQANLPSDGGDNDIPMDASPLRSFLDDVALVADMADEAERMEQGRFVVNLMTIHASKGLEFDTVFLVGLEDGTIPSAQALDLGPTSISFQEEVRLCYVAMTRAKTELFMTWRQSVPRFRSNGIVWVKAERSRFLRHLDPFKPRRDSSEEWNGTKSSRQQALLEQNPFSSRGQSRSKSDLPITQSRESTRQRSLSESASQSRGTFDHLRDSKKHDGTRSVYNRQAPPLAGTPGQTRTTSRSSPSVSKHLPVQAATSTTKQRHAQSNVERRTPRQHLAEVSSRQPSKASHSIGSDDNKGKLKNNGKVAEVAAAPAPVVTESSSSVTARKSVDSTWFYPVGSSVTHRLFGRGIVLTPTAQLLVTVQFVDNGKRMEFPLHGSDLSPIE